MEINKSILILLPTSIYHSLNIHVETINNHHSGGGCFFKFNGLKQSCVTNMQTYIKKNWKHLLLTTLRGHGEGT